MTRASMWRSLLIALIAWIATSASAALVTIDRFPANPSSLDNQTLTGIFQGNTLLPAQFRINSATVLISLSDDRNDASTTSTFTTTSVPSAYVLVGTSVSGPITTRSFLRFAHTAHTTLTTMGGESVLLTMGTAGTTVGSGSTAVVQNSISTPGPTTTVFDSSTGNVGGVIDEFFTEISSESVDAVDDHTGSFNIAASLSDPALLAELLANRSLSFSLAVLGDLELTAAQLVLDVSELTVNPGTVPEPATLALAGAGAASLALTRRRGTRPLPARCWRF